MNHPALQRILADLATAGVIPKATATLAARMPEYGVALRRAVLAEVPAFSNSRNPDILPGLEQHAKEHMLEILRLMTGGAIGDFAFVKTHAHRRAEQRFPLEATLHAYRCGHRTFSHWLREATLSMVSVDAELAISAVADFAIEYTNLISSITAAEYVDHTRMLAEAEGDRRTELMNILLSGYDEADGRVAQILKRAGYLEQRHAYCVAVAQATNVSEMQNPARGLRIANAISDVMAGSSIRTLVGTRNQLVTAVLSERRRQSGWTAPQSDLSERIRPLLLNLGPAVLVGTSAIHPSTSFLAKALHEATIALDFASVTQRVVQFSELPIRDLLVHRGNDYVQSTPPSWVTALIAANRKSDGTLLQTLRAVAEADLNVQKGARALGKHPNTVYMRIEKIKDITGLDGQRFGDLTELLLAADCWNI
jgi:PucR C-terminal helix-turn-helix domain/GGDEF-like domain